jgi:class 3 adenylate cyclase
MAGETPPSEKVDEHFQIKIIWANRKSIAILFTDIVGSTALAEALTKCSQDSV